MVNDKQVEVLANTENHYRGLHLVIINIAEEKVVLAQCFDTHRSSDLLEKEIDKFAP